MELELKMLINTQPISGEGYRASELEHISYTTFIVRRKSNLLNSPYLHSTRTTHRCTSSH